MIKKSIAQFAAMAMFAACAVRVHAQAPDPAPQAAVIRAQLASMFDKPGNPVKTDPVVVVGNYAVAGWTQGDMGGRALLRRDGAAWAIVVCGGDGLKEAQSLEHAGVPKDAARNLARQVALAEKSVPAVRLKQFSLFDASKPMPDHSAGKH
jgi:hypothetical protein